MPFILSLTMYENISSRVKLIFRLAMFVDVSSTKTSRQSHSTSNTDLVVHSILVPLSLCFAFIITHGILAGGIRSSVILSLLPTEGFGYPSLKHQF